MKKLSLFLFLFIIIISSCNENKQNKSLTLENNSNNRLEYFPSKYKTFYDDGSIKGIGTNLPQDMVTNDGWVNHDYKINWTKGSSIKSTNFFEYMSKLMNGASNRGFWISFFENGNVESISEFEYEYLVTSGNYTASTGEDTDEEWIICDFKVFWENGSIKDQGNYEIYNGGGPCGTSCGDINNKLKNINAWGSIVLDDNNESWTYKTNEDKLKQKIVSFYSYWEEKNTTKLRDFFAIDNLQYFGDQEKLTGDEFLQRLDQKFINEDWIDADVRDIKIIYKERQSITISFSLIYTKNIIKTNSKKSGSQRQYVTFDENGHITALQLSFTDKDPYWTDEDQNCCDFRDWE